MSQPFDPQEFFNKYQRGERPVYGAQGGEPSLPAIRAAETLETAAYLHQPVPAEVSVPEKGRRLFDVVEMADGSGGSAYGLRRNDGLGRWHFVRFADREVAEKCRDRLTLEWLEGQETILVEGWRNTYEEEL